MMYMGYFVMAIPAGLFISRFGYRRGVVFGLVLYGVGSLLFIPGQYYLSFNMFLFALFVIGCGLTFLETAANPYATELGAKETAASRLNFAQSFKLALKSLKTSKMRAFLTMLGIIIGVGAVIVILSLGNGMTNMMQDFYSDMGSDILAVNVMTASTRTVEVSDVYNIINQKPEYYKGLSPIASAGGDTLRVAGEKYRRTGISGVNEDYTTINNYKVAKGRGIQYTDLIDNKNICVIGDYVDRRIFGGNGLGSTLKVGASEYRIVGVLEGRSKPASQYEGGNDDIVLVPYTTLMSVNNTSSVSEYYVVLQDADHSDEAQEYLQKSIKKLVSKDDYVYVMSLSAAMKQMSSMINVMVGVLTAIAGISLLVGGIGIMNIMLVSVTERTREIGIRKALGAQESTILTQFVVEAGVTSALGGCFGIVLGYIVSVVYRYSRSR